MHGAPQWIQLVDLGIYQIQAMDGQGEPNRVTFGRYLLMQQVKKNMFSTLNTKEKQLVGSFDCCAL